MSKAYALVEMGPYLGCNYTHPPNEDNRGCLRPKSAHEPNNRGFPVITDHAFVPFTKPDRIVRVVRILTAEEAAILGAPAS